MLTWLLASNGRGQQQRAVISTLTMLANQPLMLSIYSSPASLSSKQRNLESKRGEVKFVQGHRIDIKT